MVNYSVMSMCVLWHASMHVCTYTERRREGGGEGEGRREGERENEIM